jgi:hypothetical protein
LASDNLYSLLGSYLKFLRAPLLYCLYIPSFQGYSWTFTSSLSTVPVAPPRIASLTRGYISAAPTVQ